MKQFLYCFFLLCFSYSYSLAQRPSNLKLLFSKLSHYDSLKVKSYTADSIVTNALCRLCFEYKEINIDSASYYCKKALYISQKRNYVLGVALSYDSYATIFRRTGKLIKAIEYYEKALEIYKSIKKNNPGWYYISLIQKEGVTLNNISIVYQELGETTKAMLFSLKALAIAEKAGNKEFIASRTGNIGNIYFRQKQYSKAIEYYKKASSIFKETGNKNGEASSELNTGECYRELKDYAKAKIHFQNSIQIANQNGNKYIVSSAHANLAIISDEEKNYADAENQYKKALAIKNELQDSEGISHILGNIGSMYLDRNMLPEAEKYLLQAVNISDSVGTIYLGADQYFNLCSLYAKKENYSKALEYFQKASLLKDSVFSQKKTEDITRQEMNYEFSKQQDSTKVAFEKQIAIEAANKQIAIAKADKKRTIAETEKKIAVAQAENIRIATEAEKERTISETDKKIAVTEAEKKRVIAVSNAEAQKQKVIRNSIAVGAGVLALSGIFSFVFYKRKRDAVQKEKETSLNLQVAETEMKALRSQMNPHFIFNALQSIQTFLLSNKAEDANMYLLKFSKLMRAVLENSQHAEVAVKDDIQALELYMQLESLRLKYPFTYKFHIDNSVDIENDTIPPLILQPFVENAIWHGLQYKTEPGNIDVFLSKKDNTLHAIVEDNGIGRNRNKEIAKPMLLKKEALGMKLTEERLKVLNEVRNTKATFTITDLFINCNESAGTKVELLLPLVA